MNTQTVKLDVTKRPAVMPVVYLGQGDKNGTTLVADIYDNGAALTLTGYTVKFQMKQPHDAGYYNVTGTVSGSTATFAIDENYAAAVAGVTECAYVEVLSGSTVICSTNRMRVVVLEGATEGVDPSTMYDNGLNDAIDRANTAAEAAEGVVLQDVPTMTENIKGGAKLGSGLDVTSSVLSLDLVDSATGTSITADDASYLESLTIDGKAVQNGTPTPSSPVAIEVASLNWNQMFDFYEYQSGDSNYSTVTTDGDNVATCTITQSYSGGTYRQGVDCKGSNNAVVYNHMLLFTAWVYIGSITDIVLRCRKPNNNLVSVTNVNSTRCYANQWTHVTTVFPASVIGSDGAKSSSIIVYPLSTLSVGTVYKVKNAKLYDLTMMYGAGNEPTAEAFLQQFPLDNYPYDAGSWCELLKIGNSYTKIDIGDSPLASLPDGTKDELTVDSAGHVELVKRVSYTNQAVTDGVTGTVGTDVLSSTGAIANGADVYYKAATATTTDLGYIDMPTIADGAAISITAQVTPTITASWWARGASAIATAIKALRDDLLARIEAIETAIADL